jgi:hypothetical protein
MAPAESLPQKARKTSVLEVACLASEYQIPHRIQSPPIFKMVGENSRLQRTNNVFPKVTKIAADLEIEGENHTRSVT